MRHAIIGLMAVLAAAWMAGSALARDLAVLIVNDRYLSYPNPVGANAVLGLESRFRQAGYDVAVVRNFRGQDAGRALPAAWRDLRADENLVVVVFGHVVRSGRSAWLLGTDARTPDVFNVGSAGLSMGALMELGASRPGRFLLGVAAPFDRIDLGFGLRTSRGWMEAPQGVTVALGAPARLAAFFTESILPGQQTMQQANRAHPDVMLRGYISRSSPFQPRETSTPPPDVDAERAFWQRMRGLDTVRAYQRYLERYPNGRWANEARRRIAALQETPAQKAERVEAALNLTRPQRRMIQANLQVLGFDPRGIDGIFGRATRAAISAWQRSVGLADHGFLNATQIKRLQNSADRRRRQLEREAEERRVEAERRDRAFWIETGAGTTEPGLRRYLRRYPDGIYSDAARQRLKEIERAKRREAAREEREAWNTAVLEGTVRSYRIYLRQYPDGRFAEEAKARIRALSEPEVTQDQIRIAQQEEQSLGLNARTRKIIEGKLAQLGYDPGEVDGRFTRETRRAIRRYQRASAIPPTGYMTRTTMVRLVSEFDPVAD